MRIAKMENEHDPNFESLEQEPLNLKKEIQQKRKEVITELNPSELQKDIIKSAPKIGEFLGDLFYNSIKLYFDIGFNLAKRLNFDLVIDSIEKAKEDQENKK
jgi:hypothetical protein